MKKEFNKIINEKVILDSMLMSLSDEVSRSITKIYNCNEIYSERKWGLTTSNFRFYPCYKDIDDKSTLEFWLIHY